MAKVISLLQKLGLVHGKGDGEAEQVVASEPSLEEPTDPTPRGEATERGPAPRVVRLPSSRFDESVADEPDAVPIEFPFEEIYQRAGIENPEHGFTVYKLMEMIEAEGMRSLEPAERSRAITALLAHLPGGGVSIEEIARDAAQRDRALDAFEEFLGRRLADQMIEIETENETLQAEIDRVTQTHRQKIEANEARLAAERERFETWRGQKRREEEKLHAAIEPFVERHPEGPRTTSSAPPDESG